MYIVVRAYIIKRRDLKSTMKLTIGVLIPIKLEKEKHQKFIIYKVLVE